MSQISNDLIDSRAWFVFRVKTNRETRAARYVTEAGYTVAMPKVIHSVRASRYSNRRTKKSFPGVRSYILVGFDEENGQKPIDNFWRVCQLPFMLQPVGLGEYAARVKCDQIRRFLNNGQWDQSSVKKLMEGWEPDYCTGDVVGLRGIASGAVHGTVTSIDLALRKARVEVKFLGKPHEVEYPADEIFYVSTPEKKSVSRA